MTSHGEEPDTGVSGWAEFIIWGLISLPVIFTITMLPKGT